MLLPETSSIFMPPVHSAAAPQVPWCALQVSTAATCHLHDQSIRQPQNAICAPHAVSVHECVPDFTNAHLPVMQDLLPRDVPVISVSKGLERGTGQMMSELIAATLGHRHPCAFLSGPSFAKEVMDLRPTGVVAASKVGSWSLHFLQWSTDRRSIAIKPLKGLVSA